MKKIFGLIFVFLFMSGASYAATADQALTACLNNISAKDSAWQSGLNDIFGNADLNDVIVEQEKQRVHNLLFDRIRANCGTALITIAKTSQDRAIIYFKHKNKDYGFDFSISQVLDNIGIQTGILVINKRNLVPNQILKLSDIPTKQKFFNDECSDHTIWDNLDDDAAVNIAGQAVFNEYGGTQHEYFLDFADGDNRRAFPGLVLIDKTASTEEQIVTYLNIKTGIEKAQQFAAKLKGTPCSRDGLAVYLVALNVQNGSVQTSDNRDTSSAVFGSIAGAIAAGAAWVPVAGWIVAGVAGATAATIALWPQTITDIQQVMILDGPYDL